jgi:RimJ/RimL family protein N-acetyltransferase
VKAKLSAKPESTMPMMIQTERLILKAATQAMTARELAFLNNASQQAAFEQAISARVDTWPHLYHDAGTCRYWLEKITDNPNEQGWHQWYILRRDRRITPLLVGSTGFHGPPDASGRAEIGYGLVAEHQRQGIVPEAVKALSAWAFSHAHVNKLVITTLDTPELVPSSKVALKCGFHFTGRRLSDEGTLLVYELLREQYNAG